VTWRARVPALRLGPARIFRTPSRCQDRPWIIDCRGGRRRPDMRAKSQTVLPELAGEKRPRQKCVLGLGYLVSRNRSIIHVLWAVWPLAQMSWTRRRQRFAWNRLWLRSGVRCANIGSDRSCLRRFQTPKFLQEEMETMEWGGCSFVQSLSVHSVTSCKMIWLRLCCVAKHPG